MKKLIVVLAILFAVLAGLAIAEAGEREEFIAGPALIEASKYVVEPAHSMTFGSPEVGRLGWGTGKLIFTGNIDESAKLFFEHFWKTYVGECKGEKP